MLSPLSVSPLHIWSNVPWRTREQIYDPRCLLYKSLYPLISHLDYNTNGTKYETRGHLPVNLTLRQHQFRCCTVNELMCFNDVTVLLAPGAGFTPATVKSAAYHHGASLQISIFRSKPMAASFYLWIRELSCQSFSDRGFSVAVTALRRYLGHRVTSLKGMPNKLLACCFAGFFLEAMKVWLRSTAVRVTTLLLVHVDATDSVFICVGLFLDRLQHRMSRRAEWRRPSV